MREPLSVDIRLLSIPTVADLRTSRGDSAGPTTSANRQLVVVRLETTDGFVGWGECSALNEIGYSHESALSSFHVLTGSQRPTAQDYPMAAAAMEMARLDLRLRQDDRSLAEALQTTRRTVRAGAALGLESVPESVAEAGRLVMAGYQRVKVKIGPNQIEIVPAALRMTFPDLEIQVDANGSLDESHIEQLEALGSLGVSAIEQPFAVDRPDLAAKLIARTPVPIVADEAVPDLDAAKSLHDQGALAGVSIKPPRVGGLSKALELLAWCVGEGVAATAGGMLESALGRHSLVAFAAVDGLNLVGDVSPSRRWLATDPWPDLEMQNGDLVVPTAPGVAPLPDEALIDELTTNHWSGVR